MSKKSLSIKQKRKDTKNEHQVITTGQGASEMYIKNDTLYTVVQGTWVGVGMNPSDVESLAQMGNIAAFTTGLTDELLVGEEEINGIKTKHFQASGPSGSVDMWANQETGEMVRMITQGPTGQIQIDITDVNALESIELPDAYVNSLSLPSFR
jgi:hypothetical protein